MSVEANERLVVAVVDRVIDGGDLESVGELYADDLVDAAQRRVAPFRDAFPGVHVRVVGLMGEGDVVVGQLRCSGTRTGPWMGRPATGGRFEDVLEVYGFTVRDGRSSTGGAGGQRRSATAAARECRPAHGRHEQLTGASWCSTAVGLPRTRCRRRPTSVCRRAGSRS